jgi:hypothetical protein
LRYQAKGLDRKERKGFKMKGMIILAMVFLALSLVAFFAIPFHALGAVIAAMLMAGVFVSLASALVIEANF